MTAWSGFSGDEVAALTQGASFFADPGERDCPACGRRRLRAYFTTPASAKRPTLVSYVWCGACDKFVGTRAKHPEGLIFSDPLATLPADERRALEGSLTGFLAHLDSLWDSGALPQTFSWA
ncbi:hypothetical protein Aca07nite_13940 [Actinoplanes capillaceus]|uniref:Uncharacterized protein n=1 Tax=Actinoplanes campanulatus TaxID=113559 RepID=A0ABQ3WAP4_9ACTN|nr:hypothetical protein [Actinoplanes capillaceus]GID44119.1 hypothetical protein Aca07nite_13940 [Actinoplanes capillaceus]